MGTVAKSNKNHRNEGKFKTPHGFHTSNKYLSLETFF